MSSASRGLAPRKGLEWLSMKMGRTRLLVEPRRGPQQASLGTPVPRTPTPTRSCTQYKQPNPHLRLPKPYPQAMAS